MPWNAKSFVLWCTHGGGAGLRRSDWEQAVSWEVEKMMATHKKKLFLLPHWAGEEHDRGTGDLGDLKMHEEEKRIFSPVTELIPASHREKEWARADRVGRGAPVGKTQGRSLQQSGHGVQWRKRDFWSWAVENETLRALNVPYRLERRKHGGKLN